MSLTLTFLGSGDAFGSGGRFQTCLHLAHDTGALLIDCGASSLVAMQRAGVDPSAIDAVVLTHLHGDHFGGVPFLILHSQFARRTRPLTVVGPPGVEARVRAALEVLFPGSSTVERRFATIFLELEERAAVDIAGAIVIAYPVVHASGAPPFAVRVTAGGRSVAYSGDTEWTDTLREAADGADVFVCEAYTWDRKLKFHLDWATLAAQRATLRCPRLILTHMGPEMLARRAEAGVECAEDGARVPV
ncbi:MAG: MBL fold metallo-hydrolase [Candidatus Rokubacteria bacterium]|nr:MBL fold metallo-hydrolase [Candidatus Rokubacteria bacterium]MBI3827050.1 MBL fold metallo-hydrolase [Candidatus Rokubacteria bacterium]